MIWCFYITIFCYHQKLTNSKNLYFAVANVKPRFRSAHSACPRFFPTHLSTYQSLVANRVSMVPITLIYKQQEITIWWYAHCKFVNFITLMNPNVCSSNLNTSWVCYSSVVKPLHAFEINAYSSYNNSISYLTRNIFLSFWTLLL